MRGARLWLWRRTNHDAQLRRFVAPQPLARLVHAEPHEDVAADDFPVGSVLGAALGFCQGDGFASVPDASLGSRDKCFGQVPNLQKPTRELRGSFVIKTTISRHRARRLQ